MQVRFKKTTTLSPDGINEQTYQEGQVYEARSKHEARVFEGALGNGSAVPLSASGDMEVKVAPPVENKKSTPTTTKKVKRSNG